MKRGTTKQNGEDGDEAMQRPEPTPAHQASGVDLSGAIKVRLESITGDQFEFKNEKGNIKRTTRKYRKKERDMAGRKIRVYESKGRVYWTTRE